MHNPHRRARKMTEPRGVAELRSLRLENGQGNEHAVADHQQNWCQRLSTAYEISVSGEERESRKPPPDKRAGARSGLCFQHYPGKCRSRGNRCQCRRGVRDARRGTRGRPSSLSRREPASITVRVFPASRFARRSSRKLTPRDPDPRPPTRDPRFSTTPRARSRGRRARLPHPRQSARRAVGGRDGGEL